MATCNKDIIEKICDVSDISMVPMTNSPYIQPHRLKYYQNGKAKIWDLVTVHDNVAIIIYNIDRKKIVIVKQFRPAVYFNCLPKNITRNDGKLDTSDVPISMGVTLELCAGIVDRKDELVKIAQSEVLEECGYNVPLQNFEKIKTLRTGIGMSGEQQNLYYAQVTNSMKVSEGGGLAAEGEMIEVVELSMQEVDEILEKPEVNAPGSFFYALLWFKCNKLNK